MVHVALTDTTTWEGASCAIKELTVLVSILLLLFRDIVLSHEDGSPGFSLDLSSHS